MVHVTRKWIMVRCMATPAEFAIRGTTIPAADRPACWWALLVGAPPAN